MASIFDLRAQQKTIDALAQADADGRQQFLRDAADMGEARLEDYKRYRNAYTGHHNVVLTDRQRRYLQRMGVPWSENFCETIVDWMVDRMCVEGFEADLHTNDETSETDAEETAEQTVAETVNGWWQQDRMDETQAIVHEETAVCRDGFVIVDWDNSDQRPRFTYNQPEHVKPVYSPDRPGELEYVAKVWNSTLDVGGVPQRIRRLNLYFDDRIEKWYSFARDHGDHGAPANWHAFIDPEDYEPNTETDDEDGQVRLRAVWPIPWTDDAGQPLGIPVVHFRNKPTATGWGRSELHAVIPQNEALEKLIQDLFDVVDYMGAPVPWVTGMDGDMDRTFTVGEWLKIGNHEAKVGMLAGADPQGILDAISAQLQRIAARSRTPLHALVAAAAIPSGESLKAAEAPGVKKVRKRCVSVGNSWADCMSIGVRLANHFGNAGLPDDVTLDTVWEDPETRNEQAEATTAGLWHDLGVSKHTLLARGGFDPDKEAELRKTEADEAMQQQEAQLSAGLLGAGAYRAGAQDAPTKGNPVNRPPKVPGQ